MLVALIGGSGLQKIENFNVEEKKVISTPFGEAEIFIIRLSNHPVIFLPRHREGHKLPPHKINYRANIYALYKMGVDYIIATNAVGSLRNDIKPGTFVFPDQIIDMTKNRVYTFFDGDFEVKLKSGEIRKGVVHIDVTNPYCEKLRSIFKEAAKNLGIDYRFGGTYVCTEGPRFETPAEIKFFRLIGGDIVGMTGSPEVFLAKELDMCYASISVVTNYAAGMQEKVSHEEVLEIFRRSINKLINLISESVAILYKRFS